MPPEFEIDVIGLKPCQAENRSSSLQSHESYRSLVSKALRPISIVTEMAGLHPQNNLHAQSRQGQALYESQEGQVPASRDAPLRHVAILGSRGFPSTYSGYETLVRHLARTWTRQGILVTVFCRRKPEGIRTWKAEGVECRWTPGIDSKQLSTLTFGASGALAAARLPLDAALILNLANGFFLPILKARGIGTAVNTDGIEWERGKWGSIAKNMFLRGAQATARHADVVVADSEEIARIWQDQFSVESTFIPYGAEVPEESGSDRLAELGLIPGTYPLVVARVTPENNPNLLLDAVEGYQGVPLVFVGSANYDSPIEKRLRRMDRDGLIQWLGHINDQELLRQLWENAGVYLHGHSVGGTNPSLLQALGYGSPTLALDTRFNREVIGRDDQLFPPDAQILSRSIETILSDPSRRAEWARRGRDIVRSKYSWDDVCARYLTALEVARERRANN